MSETKQVYTESELCEILHLHRDTLRKLRREGKLGYTRVPRGIRYTQKHLDEYLKQNDMSPNRIKKAS